MIARWNCLPLFRECHHSSSIENPESKQVIEFKTDAIHRPMKSIFSIVQRISFRCENRQVLNVTPWKNWAVTVINLITRESSKLSLTYFASNASANTPAASGAAAEVPECVVVHLPYRSVVAYMSEMNINEAFYLWYVGNDKLNYSNNSIFIAHDWYVPPQCLDLLRHY